MQVRVASLVVLASFVLAGVASDASQPPRRGEPSRTGTARISGTVVAAENGMPVRGAGVRLVTIGAGSWVSTTNAQGQFEFGELPAGHYSLSASKAGFVTTTAGQNMAAGRPQPIELRDGETLDRVVLKLPRGGVITGRVVDEQGEPVVEAEIRAFRAQYMQGIRRLASVRGTVTNDLGQFRLYGLEPGTYYVSGTLRAGGVAPIHATEPDVQVARGGAGFAPTFFPGTVNAATAEAVNVAAGVETLGIDFALQSVRIARITGAVVDSRGSTQTGYLVMLNGARSDRALLTSTNMAEVDAEGRFTLSNVAPGEYRLDVRSKSSIERIAQTGGVGQPQDADAAEFASVPVVISGADIDGMRIVTGPGFRLAGRVTVEGVTPQPEDLARVTVGASYMSGGVGVSAVLLHAHAPVRPDGTFEIRGVSGTRLLRPSGLPGRWMLKKVQIDGVDVTDDGFDVTSDADNVEIIITARPTAVTGIVRGDDGAPASDATIIIFPEDRRRWQAPFNRFVTSARAAADGAFRVDALPAGSYLAIAVDALIDGWWAEPGNLERLAKAATAFALAEGENKTLNLTRRAR